MGTARARTPFIAIAGAVALAGAGCSGGDIAERMAEEAVEQAAGGEGEVDLDLDEDGQGSVSVETSEGSFSMNAGGDLPPSFPDDLPLPSGDFQVASSMEQESAEDGLRLNAALLVHAPFDDVATEIEQALPDAGWEASDTRRTSMGETSSVTLITQKGDTGALVTVVAQEKGETMVNYTVGPADDIS